LFGIWSLGFGISNVGYRPTAGRSDWQDNPVQAAELTNAGLAPANPLESAIAAALPPGPYTALLSGMRNSTGIGVVEVYDRGE
jgi:hypothetical protein